MKDLFKNQKVEITGLIAWSLISFAAINISIQLFHHVLFSAFMASFICCLLNSFFLMAFYEFKLPINTLWLFTMLYVGLIIIFQILFDELVRLNGSIGGWVGYIVIAVFLIFWNMTNGTIIRVIANAKK